MKNWLGKLLLAVLRQRYVVERLELEPGNELWRLCWHGYHRTRWFARLDWGSVGWRLTRRLKPEHKMEAEAGPQPKVWRR